MYNAINFSYTLEWLYSGTMKGPNPIDNSVIRSSIATLLCPSDGVINTCSGYAQYIGYQPGNFNYVANTGHPRNVLLPGDPPNGGTLPPLTGILSMSRMYVGTVWCQTPAQNANTNVNVTLASITDGTSNTAAVSESLVNDGSGNSSDKRRNLYYTSSGLIDAQNNPSVPALAVVQDGLAHPIELCPLELLQGADLGVHRLLGATCVCPSVPPNTPPISTYHTDTFRCQEGDSGMCPTSNHPGGVNVSFMDGSVHFVKNSVNLQTWWFMGTRGRGEIISSDSY